ncbi:hypothetical protein AB0E59_17615 [Lentzea sp. NPDC034063]|uniref:hypothetical protein n=1 Tax=unclassified Lentzea TaxID=2643253 RepID=UPI0033FA71C1
MSTVQDKLTEDELVLLTTYNVLGVDAMAGVVAEHHHAGASVVAETILHAALELGEIGRRGNSSVVAITLARDLAQQA